MSVYYKLGKKKLELPGQKGINNEISTNTILRKIFEDVKDANLFKDYFTFCPIIPGING